MVKYKKLILGLVMAIAALSGLYLLLHHQNVAVLNSKGPVAVREKALILTAAGLSLIVVLPVYAMTIYIALKYRASNSHAKYQPNWDHSRLIEGLWWLVPTILIGFLATLAWNSSHQLDPYRQLASKETPINIDVVAMDWKWLFLYPREKVATIGYFKVPINHPVDLQITADAPMNSFWLPNLGGQIYAMPGMDTQLHLLASSVGNYPGSSANISGSGFASMTFSAQAVSVTSYQDWLRSAAKSSHRLSQASYSQLARPSVVRPQTFALEDNQLFAEVINKYMLPPNEVVISGGHLAGHSMEGM